MVVFGWEIQLDRQNDNKNRLCSLNLKASTQIK